MIKYLPPLNSLLAFESSARLGSFKKASEELNLTPAAIAYQIKKLEEAINVQLFTRHHKGVEINQAGQSYLVSIQNILQQLQTETQNLVRSQGLANLKIVTLHAIAEKWLMPRLKQFRQLHPKINIEISATDIFKASDKSDIVIGFSHQRPGDADIQIFMKEEIFPVCSTDYLATHPIYLENLADFDLMIDAHWHKDWEYWLNANNSKIKPTRQHSLSFSLYSMVIDAAVKGMGIMMGHKQLISAELRDGSLVKVFPDSIPVNGYYTWKTGLSKSNKPQIEFFTDWLEQQTKQ